MSWSSAEAAIGRLSQASSPHHNSYLGFYSSWLGGYFREPWAMLMPLDDHGFHRGDAVFEAVRIHGHAFFDLEAHLQRLQLSAASIGLKLPHTPSEIKDICVNLGRLCAADMGVLRLYVTRGPGGFSPNPFESVGAQIYAAITTLRGLPEETYQKGARLMLSTVPAKDGFWSQIKSCNYLQNVLMKKECVERGYDFAISLDGHGLVCEGATENFALLSPELELLVPDFKYTLRGTTVSVVMNLAQELVRQGLIKSVKLADIRRGDLSSAREAAMIGTTLGVLPIGSIADQSLTEVPSVFPRLREMLLQEMASNARLRQNF